jgi:hypothetical protein
MMVGRRMNGVGEEKREGREIVGQQRERKDKGKMRYFPSKTYKYLFP